MRNAFLAGLGSSVTTVTPDTHVHETNESADEPSAEDEPDGFFGLVVGLYAATLLAPGVTILVALGVTTDPAALFFSLLGSVVSFASIVGWYARPTSVAVRLGRARWVWLAVVLPFGYAAVLLFAVGAGLPGAVAGVAIVAMVAGMFLGMGLATAARNRYAKAMLADAEECARFDARAPERERRLTTGVAALLLIGGAVGVVLSVFAEVELAWNAFTVLLPLATGLLSRVNEKTLAVADAGLSVKQSLYRTLDPWDEFESFSVTDDALVVRRAGWSAWGLRDVRRDPDEIENLEAVADALGRFLPRE